MICLTPSTWLPSDFRYRMPNIFWSMLSLYSSTVIRSALLPLATDEAPIGLDESGVEVVERGEDRVVDFLVAPELPVQADVGALR